MPERLEEWGVSPAEGVTVQGAPLLSVHTHFREKRDQATMKFNEWVFSWLKKIPHPQAPTAALIHKLTQDVPAFRRDDR